jgi:hypothetical protein
LRQPIPASLPQERLGLHQCPDRLLQEERVPALDQALLERRQPGIVAEERLQQLPGALCRERIQPHLAVGRLAAPGVLVLGAVVDEPQQARRAEAVDQPVEQRLGLTVDPVEILEDQEEGLLARFPQQQPPHGVKCLLATLSRVEGLPCGIVHGHVEQSQQRRQRRLERAVEGEQLARHLLPNLAEVIPLLDLEVALEEVDHRKVAGRLAVGDGGTLEGQPPLQAMRVAELVDEPRLAQPVLSENSSHARAQAARW